MFATLRGLSASDWPRSDPAGRSLSSILPAFRSWLAEHIAERGGGSHIAGKLARAELKTKSAKRRWPAQAAMRRFDGRRLGNGAGGTGAGGLSDYVLPFQLASGARGRLIRLGPAVDGILTKHAYPEPVLLLLGEAVALTAMLGASLKFDRQFILQTQSDGPVSFLVVQYSSPGHLRGYANDIRRGDAGRERPDRAGGAAWRRPSGHDHRSRRRHGALSGHRRAGERFADRCRARIFRPVGADPDLHPHRGRAPFRWKRRRSGAMVVARGRADGAEADRRGRPLRRGRRDAACTGRR